MIINHPLLKPSIKLSRASRASTVLIEGSVLVDVKGLGGPGLAAIGGSQTVRVTTDKGQGLAEVGVLAVKLDGHVAPGVAVHETAGVQVALVAGVDVLGGDRLVIGLLRDGLAVDDNFLLDLVALDGDCGLLY